jgi:hypothetical protein
MASLFGIACVRDQMFSTLEHDRTKPKSCPRAVLLNHNGNCTLLLSLYVMCFNIKTRYKYCIRLPTIHWSDKNLLETMGGVHLHERLYVQKH